MRSNNSLRRSQLVIIAFTIRGTVHRSQNTIFLNLICTIFTGNIDIGQVFYSLMNSTFVLTQPQVLSPNFDFSRAATGYCRKYAGLVEHYREALSYPINHLKLYKNAKLKNSR